MVLLKALADSEYEIPAYYFTLVVDEKPAKWIQEHVFQ